jgi:LacI family transcriptional regulator
MQDRRHVALIVETSVIYGREILRGIARYLESHERWSVFLDERELEAPPPEWLLDWQGDGVICRPTTPDLAEGLRRRGLATVDLNDRFGDLGLPRIGSDMQAIGRTAAEHLLERGFGAIAYCGFESEVWSEARLEGVRQKVEPVSVLRTPWRGLREHAWEEERNLISEWLASLPKPLGVIACNDVRGYHVLDACRSLGIAVPEEVAVIGVDNADTFCSICDPPLSSVVPSAERIGYEAAALLERLMDGEAPPAGAILLEPIGIEERESTDCKAIHDPLVAQAARYIRAHSSHPLSVDDLGRRFNASRSTLERRFRAALGHSPHDEILKAKIKRIQTRLAGTDWPISRIADELGYENPEYLMVQFKRETGLTPTEWRVTKKLSISR